MPYLELHTNTAPPSSEAGAELLVRLSAAVAARLGKPESYVMTRLAPPAPMTLGGSAAPTACVLLQGIGAPSSAQATALNQAICAELERALAIPPDRVFLIVRDVPASLWGLGGRMLG